MKQVHKIYPYTEIRDENLSPSKFVKFLYVCRSKSLITLKYIQLWRRKFCLQLIFFQFKQQLELVLPFAHQIKTQQPRRPYRGYTVKFGVVKCKVLMCQTSKSGLRDFVSSPLSGTQKYAVQGARRNSKNPAACWQKVKTCKLVVLVYILLKFFLRFFSYHAPT